MKTPSARIPGTTLFDGAQAQKGYALNKMCFSFNDAVNRAAFVADEEAYMNKFGLNEHQAAAIRARNVLQLIAAGDLANGTATTAFTKYLRRIVCTSIVGGMPYPRQLDMLAKMPDILVATPGRLLDHIGSGRIDLSQLTMLVFDEADRMLDMGFSEDIDAIMGQTPETRQTLMNAPDGESD